MLPTRMIQLYCMMLNVLVPIVRSESIQTEPISWPKDDVNLNTTFGVSDAKSIHFNDEQVALYQQMSVFSSGEYNIEGSQTVQNKLTLLVRKKRNVMSINDTSASPYCPGGADFVSAVIMTTLFISGVLTNGVLLITYARHKEMRTPRNIMFINLAVTDMVFLVIFVGVYGIGQLFGMEPVRSFDEVRCRFYVFLSGLAATITPYSIAVISVQRYFGVAKFSNPKMEIIRRNFTRPRVLLSLIWALSFLLSLPEATRNYETAEGVFSCGDPYFDAESIFILITFALIPLTIIVVFWIITARQLRRESEAFRRARFRGARVLLALTIVFLCTYIPAILCNFITRYTKPNESTRILCCCSKVLLPINSVINPIALCVVSGRFRNYFRHYLLCCWCKEVVHSENMEVESTYETHL